MKVDSISLLTKLAGIVGITGASVCFSMIAKADKVIDPNPSPQISSQSQIIIAQGRPSIFDECPYNRAACGNRLPTTPNKIPTQPDVTVPTTPVPGSETPPTTTTDGKDVVAVASSNPSFSVLTTALKAAGLTETLQGEGPFTIFAPTDEAFAKLPQDAVRDLLKPENKEVLVKILTYHVVSGNLEADQLETGEIKSLEGGAIKVEIVEISSDKKNVKVGGANVVTTDIKGTNGVIHSIDEVILPASL